MIRACGWRDLGALRRLTAREVCLHSQAALTTGARVMQKCLVGLCVTRRGATTLVRRGNSDEATAFAQMKVEYGAQRARVCFLAPMVAETSLRVTAALLERLAREAGNRGARNIVAEAHDSSAEFLELRRAGFVIYARQQVSRGGRRRSW